MNGLKKLLPDVAAIVLFVVLSFAYFYPAVFEGRILAQHDAVAGIGAGREHQEYHQEHGKVTRWTNSLFSGMPTYQLAPGYDSSRTLNTVQDLYHLYLPTYVWYVFVMLLGFYILLRAFNFKVWMAALGAIIWAFSSYFFIIIAAGHIWKFVTLAYINSVWREGMERKGVPSILESNGRTGDSRRISGVHQLVEPVSHVSIQ